MWRRSIYAILLALPVQAGEFFTLEGHGGPIMGIAVAPDGQIATASFDNSVGLWTNRVPRWFEGHDAAVNVALFARDALYTGGDDFAVLQWDLETGVAEKIIQHQGKVMGLAMSRDNVLATASWDGTISLHRAANAIPLILKGHTAGVNVVAFSTDGQTLYSASVDGTIRIWDVENGDQTAKLVQHGFGLNELIVTDHWIAYGAVDGVTRIIDRNTGDNLHDFTLDRRPILSMAYDATDGALAVGDGEGFIMIIDTNNWRIAHDFRATVRGPIWALMFSTDGENLHAGGIDDTMFSWPVKGFGSGRQMAEEPRSFLADPATLPNGERQFKRKCSVCHSLSPNSKRRAGPSLHGIFGRRAGELKDYPYSDILAKSQIVWSDSTINALFDKGPDHYIPGSKMPMQRITQPQDRKDLITYLRHATTTEGNLQ
ncbi:MAG: c-type cytochrome [Litoreibacter sp.]